MRFGLNYHRYQVPEWAPFYVPYPLLKKLLKTAIRAADPATNQPDFKEVYTCLEHNINSFGIFHHENYDILRQRVEELHNQLAPKSKTLSKTKDINCYELENILKAVIELRKDSEKLQWYYRVNKEAVQRIYAKLEKLCRSTGHTDEGHKVKWTDLEADRDVSWLKYTGSLNELMTAIIQIRSDMKIQSGNKSCLDNTSSHLSASSDPIRALDRAVIDDDVPKLSKMLEETYSCNTTTSQCFQEIVYDLAGSSVVYGSKRAAAFLLSETFSRYHITLDHRILNQMIIISGRQQAFEEYTASRMCSQCSCKDSCGKSESNLFSLAVEQLALGGKDVLLEKDAFGRHPLHYGAIYGLPGICELLLDLSQKSGQEYPARLIMSLDSQRFTPLHYAVINNHALVIKAFLKALEPMMQTNDESSKYILIDILRDLLAIAIKYHHGETALYVAARSGKEEYVDMLLKHGSFPDLDIPETVHGWTPLFIACVEGHHAVAKLLLDAAAKQDIHDYSGWTAKEHAAPIRRNTQSFRTDCHYLIINLGVLQSGKQVKAVELRERSPKELISMNAGFLMEISISERGSIRELVELPSLTDMTHEPFVFPVTDPDRAWLSFKFLQASSTLAKEYNLLGGGTALIGSPGDHFGENRESLIRERTVPILEKDTLDVLGKVTFTFVISKPISYRAIPLARPLVVEEGVQLVGHRGLGQNTASHSYLQIGENTIESFLLASKQGATIVEFGNTTSHESYLACALKFRTDIPIHDLNLDQFMHASNIQSPRGDPVSVLGKANAQPISTQVTSTKPRSRSLTKDHERGTREIRDRMKYTVDFVSKGFKPNTRGDFIQDSFTTLEELLEELPESISFNIEIKYPRLHEAIEAGVAPVAIEINTFIDKALERLFSYGNKKRTIILSSFTPEICILLAIKQQTYPVMFITNAGKPPVTDREMRAASIQSAVRFAKRWNLSGLVFASEALVMCPRLVRYVQRSGLICGSYGSQNNIPENAKTQAAAGIDIIMADRVGLIAMSLKGYQKQAKSQA
ncbi:glycerophosphoryl diester phosphodiesterase [Aspergillus oryzae]|uniref:Glycerophosphoryl diester phosphodiesterase n=1 Tax=Aspergillus oryzae TaxID=5062 RepID=A0A1S9DE89_ASPOZ|nr:glycerophosphoryl diester phosphodiesterase [Aspergillus oryzae]